MTNTKSSNTYTRQYDGGKFVNRVTRTAVPTTNSPEVIIGPLSVGTTEIGEVGDILNTGNIRCNGNITAFYSDERLKVHVGEIDDALDKVCRLTAFYYHANKTAEALGYDPTIREVGLSAQEVQAILPEAVAPAPADPNYLTIKYERLIPLLVEAIKDLQAQVQELKQQAGN